MKKLFVPFLVLFLGMGVFNTPQTAFAQSVKNNSAELSSALSRLRNNPRYQGRILGTHLRHSGNGYVYEVRILRPDDSVIIVFISPKTGGVIGDSEQRSRNGHGKKKKYR